MVDYYYTWLSTGETHRGSVREINEDAFLERPDIGLWIVADGMGGHKGGKYASRMIVDELSELKSGQFSNRFELLKCLHESIEVANSNLRKLSQERYNGAMVGTTVVALLLDQEGYTLTWAGDSRAYLLREQLLMQVTKDHSQVAELVDSGALTEQQAEAHPLADVITRAVGAASEIELETIHGEYNYGDTFLLCSDGITKELSEQEIAELLINGNLMESRRALIYSSLVRKARDNITAIVVKINKKIISEDYDTTIPF